jgi:RHS Repeat
VTKSLTAPEPERTLAEHFGAEAYGSQAAPIRSRRTGIGHNLNLNHLLSAQVGKTTMTHLSDRERAGLRGPVKTCSHFFGDEGEPMTQQEYAADGHLLLWRGRLRMGRVEQVYSYDESGKLIRITDSGSGATDEFHYDEQGKKTRVRTVPPSPGQQNTLMGFEIIFDATEDGDGINGGGTVTTRYNDDDRSMESLVRDAHGALLTRITHNYTNGQLISETLVQEGVDLPREFWEQPSGKQLSEREQRAIRAQMKEALSQHGFGRIERSYFYDNQGRVGRRLLQTGNIQLETSTTYNEHGDEAATIRIQSGSLPLDDPKPAHSESQRSEVRYFYEYDNHGNWTQKTNKAGDRSSSYATHRKLTYY